MLNLASSLAVFSGILSLSEVWARTGCGTAVSPSACGAGDKAHPRRWRTRRVWKEGTHRTKCRCSLEKNPSSSSSSLLPQQTGTPQIRGWGDGEEPLRDEMPTHGGGWVRPACSHTHWFTSQRRPLVSCKALAQSSACSLRGGCKREPTLLVRGRCFQKFSRNLT